MEIIIAQHETIEARLGAAPLLSVDGIKCAKHELRSWPRLLFACQHLVKLCLPSNQLTEIPDAIQQLAHLTELHLNDNLIAHVSDRLAKCTQLQVLDIGMNCFERLPHTLVSLKRLQILQIEGNPYYRGSNNNWNTKKYCATQTSLAYIGKRFAPGNGARDACIAFMLYYRRLGLPKDVAVSCIARRWVWPTRDDDDVWFEPNLAAKDRRAGVRYIPTYSRGE